MSTDSLHDTGDIPTSGRITRAFAFAVVSCVCLMAATVLDLHTGASIDVFPGRVEWTVAGSTISAPVDVGTITALTIASHDGLFPTGAESLAARSTDMRVTRWPVPPRFHPANGGFPPVGDWWVDAEVTQSEVFETDTRLGSDFTIEGVFTGRFHQHLNINLVGNPGVTCSFRRGLLNNDLHIVSRDGVVLASGSLDPRFWDRLGAIGATILRAVSGGALLIGVWTLLFGRSTTRRPSQEQPTGRALVGVLVISAAAATVTSVWIAADVLEGIPHLPDEVVYRLQSHWLLAGSLTGAEPACSEHFKIPFTYFRTGRWIGHYPPAWPLMLVPGTALGISWAVAPVLRFVFVILVGLLGARLGGRWVGIGAALLAATSPFATLLFATTMPHAGSATLLLAAIYLCLSDEKNRHRTRMMLAGASLGVAFAIRPLTAVACAVPIGLFLVQQVVRRFSSARCLAWVVGGGLLTSVPALIANALVTGSPWMFPYSLAEGPMVAPGHLMFGIRNADTLLASLVPLLQGWGWPWMPNPFLLTLPLAFAFIPFLLRGSSREERFLLAVVVSVVVSNVIARAHGLHGFGPRYLFAACAPLWVLTACGVGHLARFERPRTPVAGLALALLIVSAAAALPARLERFRGYNDVDRSLLEATETLPSCSIVLLPEDDWRGWSSAAPWLDPEADEGPVFALDLEDNSDLAWCFPDHALYTWWDGGLEPFDPLDEPYTPRTSAATPPMRPRP